MALPAVLLWRNSSRAAADEPDIGVIVDADAAAVDDDASAGEGQILCAGGGERVVRRSRVEGPAAHRGDTRERHVVLVGRIEERRAGRHRVGRPVGGGIEVAGTV